MEHPCELAEWIGDLLFDENSSDMTFVVEEESLPAHKAIVAASNEYFRALLRGHMKESLQSRVHLKDIPLRGFKLLMSYIYTGQLKLGEWDEEAVLEILEVAHLYGFEKVEYTLRQHLQRNFSLSNIWVIFEKAVFLRLGELSEACSDFMDKDPEAILASETFYLLPADAFYQVISRDTFCGQEIDIFKAVKKWYTSHITENGHAKVLEAIRLPLIATAELVTTVKDSALIDQDCLFEAVRIRKSHAADLKYRGAHLHEKNLATPELGALMLTEVPCGKIAAPTVRSSYDGQAFSSISTLITVKPPTCFSFGLSRAFFVNHISFEMVLNRVHTAASYYIEVSVDLAHWFRLIDHSEFICKAIQTLYFSPRVIRYIRVNFCTRNAFQIQNLRVLYVEKPFKLACGFYAPEENVASEQFKATVSGSTYALIRNFPEHSQDESKWTSHKIGAGSNSIHLSQPFTVNSIKMLLRENYLYYIETSLDQSNWTRVADRTKELCSSWQIINFEPIPVLFIKIVGTASTGGQIFQFAHFQCPAPAESHPDCPPNANDVTTGFSNYC